MERIISVKATRFLKILEMTYLKGTVSFDDIIEVNKCSRNTVKADIDEIESRWNDLLMMEVTTYNLKLNNIAMANLMAIKEEILSEEISIQFLLSIFTHPTYSIMEHSVELYYSESYLRKLITHINDFLKIADSRVEYYRDFDHSRLIIRSNNEVLLHHLLSDLVKYSNNQHMFDHIENPGISKFEEFLKYLELPLYPFLDMDLKLIAKISWIRVDQGFSNENDLRKAYVSNYRKNEFENFTNVISAVYANEVSAFFGDSYIKNNRADLLKSKQMFTSVIYRILSSCENIDNNLNRYNIFKERFIQQNKQAYLVLEKLINTIEEHFDYCLKSYMGEIIYSAYNNVLTIRSYASYNIGVNTDLGVMHANAIILFMSKHFSMHNTSILDDTKDYDFVLSTSSTFKHKDAITIPITDLPGRHDIDKIYTALYSS